MTFINKVVYLSTTHGTSDGLWPRFYFQLSNLGEMAIGKEVFDERASVYFEKVMPEILHFHDLYLELRKLITDYVQGIQDGRYYTVNEKKQISHDKSREADILNAVKNFFSRGKIVVVLFAKSGITSDSTFSYSDFFFCNSKRFYELTEKYLKESDGRYKPVLNLLEKANQTFFLGFNEIRNEIEHEHFTIDDFVLKESASNAQAFEPILQGKPLSAKIEEYYVQILEFIEKTGVYFYGMNGEMTRLFTLIVREDFNFPELKFKYVFAPGGLSMGFPSHRCLYD